LKRRYGIARAVVIAVSTAFLAILGTIQVASYAFSAPEASAGTLPTRIPASFGQAVYRALDRVAPAPYVEATLAAAALAGGATDEAEHYALRLPASPARDELLARIAASRGDRSLALEYFLAAPDVDAVQSTVSALATSDPASAYFLERTLNARLSLQTIHPDAVAETNWRMGELANRRAWREIPGSLAQGNWLRRGMSDFQAAVDLATLSGKFAISAANQAMLLGDVARARALFAHAAETDPGSADAIAGLGVVAYRQGDRRSAVAYLARAQSIDPHSLMVRALERDLR
jgi:tetratricopeptide (TPR) repeat protein